MIRLTALLLTITATLLILSWRPAARAQFNREEKQVLESIVRGEVRAGVQEERIRFLTETIAKINDRQSILEGQMQALRDDHALLRGAGIGFGSVVSVLLLIQIFLQIRQSRSGRSNANGQ